MRGHNCHHSAEAGNSILMALVVVAIVGIVSTQIINRVTKQVDESKSLKLQGELRQIRGHVNAMLDCSALPQMGACGFDSPLSNSNCSTSQVALKDVRGKLFSTSSKTGSEIIPGVWIRACCTRGNLIVEAMRKKSSGELRKDPLNPNIVFDWQNIFSESGSPCDYRNRDFTAMNVPRGVVIASGDLNFTGVLFTALTQQATNCPAYKGELGGTPEVYIESQGIATCPQGYKVASGAVNCESVTLSPIYPSFNHLHPGAFQKLSMPSSDGTSWIGSCCLAVNAIPKLFIRDTIKATCVRQ